MKKIISTSVIALMTIILMSCGAGNPKTNALKFLNGFYHMEYADAKAVATEETKKQLDFFQQMMATAPQNMKEDLKKIKIEIKESKVEGNNATVTYIINGDPTSKNTLSMVQEKGSWLAKWDILGGINNMGSNPNTTVAPTTGDANGLSIDSPAMAPAADGTMPAPAVDSPHH